MTGKSIAESIDDARALLDTLLSSDWQDAHIVSDETEIFIARAGGQPNPMRQAAAAPAQPAIADGPLIVITAPHVATLINTAAAGTRVVAGQVIATVRVLDEDETIIAPGEGEVETVSATIGALLEFGTPVLSLRQGA